MTIIPGTNILGNPVRALAAVCLVAVTILCGCGENKFEQEVGKEKLAVNLARETDDGDYSLITTAELKKLLDDGEAIVLVDAMPADSYAKEHIPGAKRFTFTKEKMAVWDDASADGKSQSDYEKVLGDKGGRVIVYCGFVECLRSHNAARFARELGYTKVERYAGGIYAWKGAGHKTESE